MLIFVILSAQLRLAHAISTAIIASILIFINVYGSSFVFLPMDQKPHRCARMNPARLVHGILK